jgi:hypothetical protein
MANLLIQVQMLVAALSALLPLLPEDQRGRAAAILEFAATALAAAASASANVDDLTFKLIAVRDEVDAMVRAGRTVTAGELDAAMARVRAASAAFRVALAEPT